MKLTVLIDETVKKFMIQCPQHGTVMAFRLAWQEFVFQSDDEALNKLNTTIRDLMNAANGVVLLVSDESGAGYHGLNNAVEEYMDGEDPYSGVTFH